MITPYLLIASVIVSVTGFVKLQRCGNHETLWCHFALYGLFGSIFLFLSMIFEAVF